MQDPAIVSALPVEADDDEEVGEVVLSSEPQVVLPRVAEPATVAFEVQPSADVIDDIDRRTQLPAPARRAEPEVVVAAPSIIEEVEDDEEDEGYEDEEALSEAPARARPAGPRTRRAPASWSSTSARRARPTSRTTRQPR
ncbi:MAG: hypothetical protein H6730_27815 [Deltaproteobacteria bacterium]|nr:hypothetical protein [Deltaproteobacteria bacterium]